MANRKEEEAEGEGGKELFSLNPINKHDVRHHYGYQATCICFVKRSKSFKKFQNFKWNFILSEVYRDLPHVWWISPGRVELQVNSKEEIGWDRNYEFHGRSDAAHRINGIIILHLPVFAPPCEGISENWSLSWNVPDISLIPFQLRMIRIRSEMNSYFRKRLLSIWDYFHIPKRTFFVASLYLTNFLLKICPASVWFRLGNLNNHVLTYDRVHNQWMNEKPEKNASMQEGSIYRYECGIAHS